jgi:hypothetical protein
MPIVLRHSISVLIFPRVHAHVHAYTCARVCFMYLPLCMLKVSTSVTSQRGDATEAQQRLSQYESGNKRTIGRAFTVASLTVWAHTYFAPWIQRFALVR